MNGVRHGEGARAGRLDGTGAVASAGPAAAASRPGPVVLYDGACGLCDRYVQFLLRHDRKRRFRFAPLQGPFAARALARHAVAPDEILKTVVLLEFPGLPEERLRLRSDAVLAILAGLGGVWACARLLRVIPRPLRDAVYGLVARVRYRVFGKVDACAIPAAGRADRFLE